MARQRKHRRVVAVSKADQLLAGAEVGGPGVPSSGAVVPDRAAEDHPEAWGDLPEPNDRRLIEDVPPHWGERPRL